MLTSHRAKSSRSPVGAHKASCFKLQEPGWRSMRYTSSSRGLNGAQGNEAETPGAWVVRSRSCTLSSYNLGGVLMESLLRLHHPRSLVYGIETQAT